MRERQAAVWECEPSAAGCRRRLLRGGGSLLRGVHVLHKTRGLPSNCKLCFIIPFMRFCSCSVCDCCLGSRARPAAGRARQPHGGATGAAAQPRYASLCPVGARACLEACSLSKPSCGMPWLVAARPKSRPKSHPPLLPAAELHTPSPHDTVAASSPDQKAAQNAAQQKPH